MPPSETHPFEVRKTWVYAVPQKLKEKPMLIAAGLTQSSQARPWSAPVPRMSFQTPTRFWAVERV